MTTGRINQVATSEWMGIPLEPHPQCSLCRCGIELRPCISFAIVLYHCSAPASALSSKPSSSAARRTGSSAPAPWIEPQRYQVQVTCVVWMVEATIDPYNSKKSTGHPESEDEAYDEKAKKEKRINDSLIKHLLDVN